MASDKFNSLRDRFKTAGSGGNSQNNYYPFFKMPDDAQARIRFLPDTNEENGMGFLVEKVTHQLKVNGENKTVACLAAFGEECPICAVAKEYYDKEDKANGKLYYKKRSYIAQALIIEDPINEKGYESAEGKVKLISVGFSLFKIIKDAFESGELDEAPYEFNGGTDFLIKKSKQGEFASYTLSKFARKSTDLDAEQIEVATAGSIDLSTALPKKPDLTFVRNLLEAALTGKTLKEDDDGDDDDTSAFSAMKKKSEAAKAVSESSDEADKPVVEKAAVKVESSASTDDDDEEAAALLAQLKAKREAAKRAAAGE